MEKNTPQVGRKFRRQTTATANTTTPCPSESWKASDYPFEVDYCDHFETPKQAYQDICPILHRLLQAVASPIRVYDPYYCNGRTAVLLRELGFDVIHEKRDFYADIAAHAIPNHEVLVTNPPYSDQHKIRCLQFCFRQLRSPKRTPFALLMPNYVAAKKYYQDLLYDNTSNNNNTATTTNIGAEDVVYFVPHSKYHYEHPQGTGHVTSPFDSLWFLGVGRDHAQQLQRRFNRNDAQHASQGDLVTSLHDLKRHAALVSVFDRRPNPQRRRKKQTQQPQQPQQPQQVSSLSPPRVEPPNRLSSIQTDKYDKRIQTNHPKSKYRDESGQRKRKRF